MRFDTHDELIDAVAQNYLNQEEQDLTDEYRALGQYNEQRFEDIPVDVEFTSDDPYKNAAELFQDIEENDRLEIFDGGTHPDGMTHEQNIKGRAVHDYFGHYMNRVDFSLEGEFQKYDAQRHDVPDQCEDLLFAEVVGQTALVHHLDDGFADPEFRQRNVLISDELQDAAETYLSEAVN